MELITETQPSRRLVEKQMLRDKIDLHKVIQETNSIYDRYKAFAPHRELIEIPHLRLPHLENANLPAFVEEYKTLLKFQRPARSAIKEWVDENFGEDSYFRVAFSVLDTMSVMPWHQHKAYSKRIDGCEVNQRFALHIPVVSDEHTYMLVDQRNNVIEQTYGVGQVWLLNTYYPHAVLNASDKARSHCIVFLDSLQPSVLKKILGK